MGEWISENKIQKEMTNKKTLETKKVEKKFLAQNVQTMWGSLTGRAPQHPNGGGTFPFYIHWGTNQQASFTLGDRNVASIGSSHNSGQWNQRHTTKPTLTTKCLSASCTISCNHDRHVATYNTALNSNVTRTGHSFSTGLGTEEVTFKNACLKEELLLNTTTDTSKIYRRINQKKAGKKDDAHSLKIRTAHQI